MFKFKENQLLLLLLIVTCFWFAQYVYIPYQTPYLSLIHVSSNFIGIVIGAYGISQLVLRLPVGILADLQGNHNFFIRTGVLAAGLASLIRVFQPNGLGFLLGNILSGLASATWISFMILYLSYFPAIQQGKATSKIIMANNIGMLLGFITSTLLFNQVGMQVICWFSVLAGFTGFLLSLFLAPVNDKPVVLTLPELLQVGKSKRLLTFSFLALIQQGIQMSSTMSFTNQRVLQLSDSSLLVGLSSIIYMSAAVAFARLGTSSFIDKMTKDQWISFSFFLLSGYCLLIPVSPSVGLIYLLQLIPGLATGILFSLLTAEAMAGIPAVKKSTAMGIFQAIYAIGMTAFPMAAGYLSEAFSMTAAFLFLAITALIGGGAHAFYAFYKTKNKITKTEN